MNASKLITVQSVRGVRSGGRHPYYAYGVYEPTVARDGHVYYRLVASGREFRSDVHGRTAFDNIPIVEGVRHGSPVRGLADEKV